ncbi:6731_t:CDS:2 [Cetraspora pellucida]|uniref:6731_t:CDS:1 n=1 Tax=Cetraspora pellucida TaxID=1433469 RepID=A0A9N9H707_9GLOM|nr:6731_t:CDS:2 [Cetraspora pellucida]
MDKDLQTIEFNTKKVKLLLEDMQKIDCSLCNFSENEIIICLDLSKMQVCLLNKETNTESAVFDKRNYLFVMFLDYCISSFIGKDYIESAWTPYLQDQDYQRIITKITNCCELQTHQIEFCIELDKLKVCRLLKDNEGDAHTFDQGNYALVIIVNYFDQMYRFKKTAEEADADKFEETFNTEEENYTLFNIIKKCYKDKKKDNDIEVDED